MSDPRFARLKTDPRFRRPKKHQSKVVVDERFKGIFDEDGSGKTKLKQKGKGKEKLGRVDKFGRKVSGTHEKDTLRRFYRLEHENEEPEPPTSTLPDYARGGVLMESSESEVESEGAGDSDEESDGPGFITLGRDLDEEGEIDLDESTFADLDAQAAAYAKTVSEDDSKEAAEKTRRLAVVNLDWDHVRAAHLYKIFSSLVSPAAPATLPASVPTRLEEEKFVKNTKSAKATVARGKVLSVRVYPSEFGKERIAREEEEGPPVEVFKQKKVENEDDVNERTIYETGDGADYDENALRKYQLERLRYYYAIVECDTVEAAVHIYNELEGTELERSANVFDLSFVPDEMTFDEEYRDEAIDDPGTRYRAVEFVTDALRHSKVKLTWDDDDPERNHITRRPLTKKEIDEADFKAYIASSSSESDNDPDPASKKKSQKNAQRDKLRALLLAGDDDELPEGWGRDDEAGQHDDVDMEITFTPGLTEAKNPGDETTMEKYQRKMREKRKKRKEEVRVKATADVDIEGGQQSGKKVSFDDDFFEGASDSGSEVESEAEKTSKSMKQVSRTRDAHEPTPRQDMKTIDKAEKKGKKKRGKKKADHEDDEVEDEFVVDVKDDRFKAIHEDYQFAIDPSNPHFKKTKSMVALLDERTKHQKRSRPEDEKNTRAPAKVDDTSLKNLVESVKRKSAAAGQGGLGKRRKL
ncbi:uncharacterized protein EDB91DRAFT_1172489 [Suillus paluster]|uniref:uncharacterized protein n=1 Tax=Suillus paluster TaxID=48578 RepID=UPI001B87890F|nr:uncharacterized protein EDB91DRAFT_1172489 [Suillus paluster]KAG1723525.1 hypothetical protein EDB91DRAFT_1172489 [Suillus paluster]